MPIGLIGKKRGMTRVFTEDGRSVPVSVVEIEQNSVVQVKTDVTDGYNAVQIATGAKRPNRVSKPMAGHYAKASVVPGDMLLEFRLNEGEVASYKPGQIIALDVIPVGSKVDVMATSKGKGYAGVIKRHNFSSQRATHGNSLSHRAPGSIGQNQTPGKVFKGKKMSGQMGNVKTTVQNLEIVQIDKDLGVVLIKGAIPGAPGGHVVIKHAVKNKQAKGESVA